MDKVDTTETTETEEKKMSTTTIATKTQTLPKNWTAGWIWSARHEGRMAEAFKAFQSQMLNSDLYDEESNSSVQSAWIALFA